MPMKSFYKETNEKKPSREAIKIYKQRKTKMYVEDENKNPISNLIDLIYEQDKKHLKNINDYYNSRSKKYRSQGLILRDEFIIKVPNDLDFFNQVELKFISNILGNQPPILTTKTYYIQQIKKYLKKHYQLE
jgi:hypothetical protein